MYILILGLDHSRTTITDLVLGDRIGAISMGEVRRTVSPKGREENAVGLCTCGMSYQQCEIWQSYRDGTLLGGEGVAIIDSSKEIKHYRRMLKSHKDTTTILVLRKFKPWSTSVRKSRQRDQRDTLKSIFDDKQFILANLRLYLRKYIWISYIEWLATHLRFLLAIKGRAFVVASSHDIDRVAGKLGRFSSFGERHIVRGNRVASEKKVVLNDFDEYGLFQKLCRKLLEAKSG